MVFIKRPNSRFPNVILSTRAIDLEVSNGSASATFEFMIRDRCTPYGAYHDAAMAIPLIVEAGGAFFIESFFSDFDPQLDPRCLPTLYRTSLSLSETNAKDPDYLATATYSSICKDGDESVSYSTQGYFEPVLVPNETYVAKEVFSLFDLRLAGLADALLVENGKEVECVPEPGLIGEDGEGVERYVPELRLQLTKCFPPGFLANCANIAYLYNIDGCVNRYAWRCFGPREVQFQGIDATSTLINNCPPETQNLEPDKLVCNFVARPSAWIPCGLTLCPTSTATIPTRTVNAAGDTVSGSKTITVPNARTGQTVDLANSPDNPKPVYQAQFYKAGFDVVDVRFSTKTRSATRTVNGQTKTRHRNVKIPDFVYSHNVDKLCDFETVLGF